jgi:hypothetical protein
MIENNIVRIDVLELTGRVEIELTGGDAFFYIPPQRDVSIGRELVCVVVDRNFLA